MPTDHLHILARNGTNLTGDGRQLSPRDVEAGLDGTPYGTEPGLRAVIEGKVPRGYTIVDEGWVAVARCSGTDQDACAKVLESVVVGGDIRAFQQTTEA